MDANKTKISGLELEIDTDCVSVEINHAPESSPMTWLDKDDIERLIVFLQNSLKEIK